MTQTQNLETAEQKIAELVKKYGWKVWTTTEASSGWGDGVKELQAIVEVRHGKIIKIKGGGYGDYWMVESESGGWYNLSLLEEVKSFGKSIYQIVGMGWSERFESTEALGEKFEITGSHESTVTRRELQGQPIISGMNGPMFNGYENGIPVIRYETSKAYAFYSA